MRNVIIIAALMMSSLALMAQQKDRTFRSQYAQGQKLLGANFTNFGYRTYDNFGTYDLSVEGKLNAGIFVKDQWLVGASVSRFFYAFGPTDNIWDMDISINSLNLGLFTRYYFTGDRGINFFVQGGAGIHLWPGRLRDNAGNRLVSNNFESSLGAGASLPVGGRASVDFFTEGRYQRSFDPSLPNSFSGFLLRPLNIGFNFHF